MGWGDTRAACRPSLGLAWLAVRVATLARLLRADSEGNYHRWRVPAAGWHLEPGRLREQRGATGAGSLLGLGGGAQGLKQKGRWRTTDPPSRLMRLIDYFS